MKREEDSFYRSSPAPKRGSKLAGHLLDLLSLSFVSLLVFLLWDAASSQGRAAQRDSEEASSLSAQLDSYAKAAHLIQRDQEGEVESIDEVAKSYLDSLSYSSLLHHGFPDEAISKITYAGASWIGETGEEDPLCYYYVEFKGGRASSFPEESVSGQEGYLSLLRKGMEENYLDSFYPYLTKESTEELDAYLRGEQKDDGLYQKLFAHYKALWEGAIQDLEDNYSPYRETADAFSSLRKKMYERKLSSLWGSYAVSAAVLFLLVPLLAKEGRTLVNLALHQAYADLHGKRTSFGRVLLRFFVLLLESPLAVSLLPLFLYGSAGVEILSCGPLPLWWIGVFSFFVLAISYLLSFLPKGGKSTLSELASGLREKDAKEFVMKKLLNQEKENGDKGDGSGE